MARRRSLPWWALAVAATLGGCQGSDPDAGMPPPSAYVPSCQLGDLEPRPVEEDLTSDYVFNPDNLLLYEITISDDQWESICMEAREHAVAEREGGAASKEFQPRYATASVRVGTEVMEPVGLRIRGDASVETIFFADAADDDPEPEYDDCLAFRFGRKPSFKIDFTELGGSKFHGQSHFSLGGKEGGSSMMHDYLVAKMGQAFGVVGPRVNHALVCINDVYRGVFTVQEEHDDQAFLDRNFADGPDGNYYKVHDESGQTFFTGTDFAAYAVGIEPVAGTDEEYTADTDLIQFLQFANFTEPTEFAEQAASRMNVDAWLKVVAMETVIPDFDGLFSGRHNYLLYNHPTSGWWVIRSDWDHGFEYAFLGEDVASGLRLLDLPVAEVGTPPSRNRCDGRAPIDEDEVSCPGGCTKRRIVHPIVTTRLLFHERARYLELVGDFLDDAFIPSTLKAALDERRERLDAYFAAPQGEDEWLEDYRWIEDMDTLEADLDVIHEQATAALADAIDNPPPVAPLVERSEMLEACGEHSCWPYACEP